MRASRSAWVFESFGEQLLKTTAALIAAKAYACQASGSRTIEDRDRQGQQIRFRRCSISVSLSIFSSLFSLYLFGRPRLHSLFPWRSKPPLDHPVASLRRSWEADDGQDIAEYAVMLAVILVIVVGSIRLIGSNANNVFSATASSIQ
jgi:Flp pilus assembly pilin Flp